MEINGFDNIKFVSSNHILVIFCSFVEIVRVYIYFRLSVQDSSIQSNLRNKSRFVNAILESYNLKTNYLDCTTAWLTNREFIHKKGDVS